MLDADEQPAETSRAGFDDVPRVGGREEGFGTEKAAFVVGHTGVPGTGSVDGGGAGERVGFPGKGEDVEDGEDGHFDGEEDGRDADFDVHVGNCFGGVESR